MVHAFDTGMAAKIYDRLFHALVQKEEISVYTVDKEYIEVVGQAQDLELSNDLKRADIALITHEEDLPSSKYPIVFTTDIDIYKKHPSSIGVFYWQHGHPKIIFSKERLKEFDIRLSPEWSKYIRSDDGL